MTLANPKIPIVVGVLLAVLLVGLQVYTEKKPSLPNPGPTPVYIYEKNGGIIDYVPPTEYHFKETPLPCSKYVNPVDGAYYHCVKSGRK